MNQKGSFAIGFFICSIILSIAILVGSVVYTNYLQGFNGQTNSNKAEDLKDQNTLETTINLNQPSDLTNIPQTTIKYLNISFILPVAQVDSQEAKEIGWVIKYSGDKSLIIIKFSPEMLLKVSDLNVDSNQLMEKIRTFAQPELKLQAKVIEELGGGVDMNLARDLKPNGIKLIKKRYMNIEAYQYTILKRVNPMIIYMNSSQKQIHHLFVEDQQGNLYDIIINDSEEVVKIIASTLKII